MYQRPFRQYLYLPDSTWTLSSSVRIESSHYPDNLRDIYPLAPGSALTIAPRSRHEQDDGQTRVRRRERYARGGE